MLEEFFCLGEIWIVAKDSLYIDSCFFQMSGPAESPGEVHTYAAFSGSAVERSLPQCDRAMQVSGLGFDDAEVCSRVDQSWIQSKCFLVELSGVVGVAASEFNVGQSGEDCGVIRRLLCRKQQQACGFASGLQRSVFRYRLPSQGEIADIVIGLFRVGKWNEGGGTLRLSCVL